MGSTRLPGKVLKLIKGKPLLWYLIKRIELVKTPHKFIIATGPLEKNKEIVDFAESFGINYYIGSENDVLDRYYRAAIEYQGDIIVRITSDCPLIDPEIIDKGLNIFLNNNYSYLSNCHPDYTYPDGYDVEIFTMEALETAWKKAVLPSEREHVTPYIWKNEKREFFLSSFANNVDLSKFRLSVDEPEDFMLISKIIEKFYDNWINVRLNDIIRFLLNNPELLELNRDIKINEGYLRSLKKDQEFMEKKRK